jgi:hypothetical protein
MDPLAALDAASRALDCEDHAEAIDRLFDYYQYRARAMTVANDSDRVALENRCARTYTTRAQDMRDRFTQATEDKYNAALEANIADMRRRQ